MSKLVKLTDKIGNELEKWAKEDGCTLAGEIKNLLDIRAGKGVYDGINSRLDKMAEYLDKKFGHLESLIEDTTIDRIDAPRAKRGSRALDFQKEVWPLFYEKLDEDNPAWLPGAYAAAHESSDMAEAVYFVDYDKNVLYSTFYDSRAEWLRLTPEVLSFLDGEKNELS